MHRDSFYLSRTGTGRNISEILTEFFGIDDKPLDLLSLTGMFLSLDYFAAQELNSLYFQSEKAETQGISRDRWRMCTACCSLDLLSG